MEKDLEKEGYVHIVFPLDTDESGYPPVGSERLWAKKVSDGLFEIDNIPFFVTGLASGDRVTVEEKEGVLFYKSTEEYSGNSTLRVVVYESNGKEISGTTRDLRKQLEDMGCTSELSNTPNLIAIDVPKGVSLSEVIEYLKVGEEEGRWGYEEACLGQKT